MKARHCEQCGCTDRRPCPEGCGWSRRFLRVSRYVCTVCEDLVVPAPRRPRSRKPKGGRP